MGVVDNIRRFLTPGDYQEAAVVSMEQTNKFSPGVPIAPNDGYSRVPRAHDFLTGYNIAARPRRNERVSFTTLQGIIEAYDVAQMAITHRIDSVRSFDWYLEPLDGVSGDTSEMIDKAKQILKRPDHELPFRAWLSKFLWDVLAYDAGTLYRMRNNAGRCIGLRVVDGTSIAPLIDYHGNRPTGEAPAFVQFAQGVPWNWLTVEDLIYVPFRPLPNTPYGKAPMEAILLNANTDLRFQNYFLSRFTEGTVPEGFASAPETWTPDQITDYQEAWDAVMYGDETKKHQIRWVPGGVNFTWTREEKFDSEFSLFMMRKTAAAYHVTPADLGFTETVNLASSETQLDVQFRIGDLPLIQHVQEILSDFIQQDLGLPLRFLFNTGQAKDDKMLTASIHDMYIKNGVLSVSEVRQEIYGLPEPDGIAIPRFLMGGAGPIPLNVIREGAGTTDPDTGSPMGGEDVQATQYDVAQGLSTNIAPAGGGMPPVAGGEAIPETIDAPEAEPLGKEASVGITSATGVYGSPMLADGEDEDLTDEEQESQEVVKAELARFRRFVKARKKDGKWRDFEFRADSISPFEAQRLNDDARWSMNRAPVGLLCVRARDTGRVLMLQRALTDEPNAGKLDFPGGHLEDGEDFMNAAVREFCEEVGEELPPGEMRYGWKSKSCNHEGYIYEIECESDIVPRERRNLDMVNPDDPDDADGLRSESLMWVSLADLLDNPMVKDDIAHELDKIVAAASDAVPLVKGWRDGDASEPHHKYDLQIVDYYNPIIRKAIGGFVDSLPITKIVSFYQNLVQKETQTEAVKAQVRAMLGRVGDTGAIQKAVRQVLTDGYVAGTIGSAQQIGNLGVAVGGVFPSVASRQGLISSVWDSWKPDGGHLTAAEKLDNGGLRQLLADANISVQSIQDTMLDSVGSQIANGLRSGTPADRIANDIRDSLLAPYRADMIAQTESARAMTLASLDMYSEAGLTQWDLLTVGTGQGGACEACLEIESSNPHDMDEFDIAPPVHPFCRCVARPHVEGFDFGDLNIGDPSDFADGFGGDGGGRDADSGSVFNSVWGFVAGLGVGLLGYKIVSNLFGKDKAGDGEPEDGFDDSEFDEFGMLKEWDESLYERDENGRFTSGGGGAKQYPGNPDVFPSWEAWNQAQSDFRREMYTTVDSYGNPTDPGEDRNRGADEEQYRMRDEYVVPDDKTLAMNRALNAGRESTRADRIDTWVNASTLNKDLLAYRAVALPPEKADELQVGSSYTVGGYQSHGDDETAASRYLTTRVEANPGSTPVMFRNIIEAGTHAADAGYGEIVVQRNTNVTILGRSEKDGVVYLTGRVSANG